MSSTKNGYTFANCGTIRAGDTISIASSHQSSYSYALGVGHYTTLPPSQPCKCADIAPDPVPAAARIAQPRCHGGPGDTSLCATIPDVDYEPYIVIPPQVWDLNTLLSDCTSGKWDLGMFDLSIALRAEASIQGPSDGPAAQVTSSSEPPTTTASPAEILLAMPGPTMPARMLPQVT